MTKSEKFKITIQNYNIQQLQQIWIKTSNVSDDQNSMNHYNKSTVDYTTIYL